MDALGNLVLADTKEFIPLVAIIAGAAVALVWIIAGTLSTVLKTKHREQTRREIAAYVAEGTISPSDAAQLLAAGNADFQKTIADGVAWGTISSKDAERLMRGYHQVKDA